jgi:hypothetical protein
MIEEIKNIKNTKSDFRKFGITIGVFLMVVAGFLFWKGRESYTILLISGLLLSVLGLVMPIILKLVYWVWMVFAIILGWIMTRVILSVLFYVVISPIGLFSRMFGNQFIELKWDKSKDSYWNTRTTKQQNNVHYESQF